MAPKIILGALLSRTLHLKIAHLVLVLHVPPPSPAPPPQKKKTGTELKTLTSKKLLTRLPTLLAEIKARNNSSKLIEIRKRLYPFH